MGGQPLDITNEFDRRLAEGCAISCRLRGAVKQQLGAALKVHWASATDSAAAHELDVSEYS